nr:hypothetical protein [Tanacetum cinerariifolium]
SHKDGSKGEPSAREPSTMVGSYRIIVMSSVIIFRREENGTRWTVGAADLVTMGKRQSRLPFPFIQLRNLCA